MSSSAPPDHAARPLRLAAGVLGAAGLIALCYSLDLLLFRGAHPHLSAPDPAAPIGYFPRMLRALATGSGATLALSALLARVAPARQLRVGGWVLGLGMLAAAVIAVLFP